MTATKTFTFDSTPEDLTDQGNSSDVVFQYNSGDSSVQFTVSGRRNAGTEYARTPDSSITWETWGVPSGGTVTQVKCAGWKKKISAYDTVDATGPFRIRVLSGSTTLATLIDVSTTGSGTDGSYIAQSAGSYQAIGASYQASTTGVRLELESTLDLGNSGSAVCTLNLDDIAIEMDYSMDMTASIAAATSVVWSVPVVTPTHQAAHAATIAAAVTATWSVPIVTATSGGGEETASIAAATSITWSVPIVTAQVVAAYSATIGSAATVTWAVLPVQPAYLTEYIILPRLRRGYDPRLRGAFDRVRESLTNLDYRIVNIVVNYAPLTYTVWQITEDITPTIDDPTSAGQLHCVMIGSNTDYTSYSVLASFPTAAVVNGVEKSSMEGAEKGSFVLFFAGNYSGSLRWWVVHNTGFTYP